MPSHPQTQCLCVGGVADLQLNKIRFQANSDDKPTASHRAAGAAVVSRVGLDELWGLMASGVSWIHESIRRWKLASRNILSIEAICCLMQIEAVYFLNCQSRAREHVQLYLLNVSAFDLLLWVSRRDQIAAVRPRGVAVVMTAVSLLVFFAVWNQGWFKKVICGHSRR